MSDTYTTHYFNFPALREALLLEKGVRGVSQATISTETGVNVFTVNRFLKFEGTRVSIDGAVSICEWLGVPVKSFVKKRRTARRHVDSYDERQIRNAAAFLASQNISIEYGESPVDALMRAFAARTA